MSFRKNDVQQFSMFDSFNTLTPREQKALYIFIKTDATTFLKDWSIITTLKITTGSSITAGLQKLTTGLRIF